MSDEELMEILVLLKGIGLNLSRIAEIVGMALMRNIGKNRPHE